MGEHIEKFSYSKLNTFEGCGWRYKLQYIDKHFVDTPSVAADFGTLVHYVEETIANDIVANDNEPIFMLDDNKYIQLFLKGGSKIDNSKPDKPKEEIIKGAETLREIYKDEFFEPDKTGLTYNDKVNMYLNDGIYWLRDNLAANRNLQIIGAEKEFNIEHDGYIFHGYIDRIMKDINTGELIIEDIKTWPKIDGHTLTTPLQFVLYTRAASEMYDIPEENIHCFYALPFKKERYAAGTKGYMKRGFTKIDKLMYKIKVEEAFIPNPSPLCHWCEFCKTFPNQPEEAKNLCPYYSAWTRENKDFTVAFEWMGKENHEAIMKAFLEQNANETVEKLSIPSNITTNNIININNIIDEEGRMFYIRRN